MNFIKAKQTINIDNFGICQQFCTLFLEEVLECFHISTIEGGIFLKSQQVRKLLERINKLCYF